MRCAERQYFVDLSVLHTDPVRYRKANTKT
jgi:hypothetical protein